MQETEQQVTTVLSTRLDVLDIATIAYIYDQLKIEYTSRSNLLGISIHQYAKTLKEVFKETGKEPVSFESPQQAVDYLCLNKRLNIKEVKVGQTAFQEQLKKQVRINLGELDTSVRAKELMDEVEEKVDEKGIPEHLQK